jgi:hypothetical protein
MVCADKPEGICSGRGCVEQSVGSRWETHMIPEWRKPVEYPNNQYGFELGFKVFYCTKHEELAKA